MRHGRVLRLAVLAAAVSQGVWAQTPGSSPAGAAPRIDRAVLLEDLRTLSSDTMEGRAPGTPGGARARAYVLGRFKQVGLAPINGTYLQPVTVPGRSTGREGAANIVGLLPGTRTPRRYVVVSAHYDHVGVRGGVVFNGANDNASGTAALMAIASHFRDRRPAHSLVFAAFDAEEDGLIGARAFVTAPPVDRTAIVLNVNVDMIGREPADRLFVVGTRLHPALKPIIERVAARAPLTLLMGHDDPAHRDEDWTRDSDHYAFIEAGIPALLFSVEDTAQHHRPTDDYDTMTTDFYLRAVQTIIEVIERFD